MKPPSWSYPKNIFVKGKDIKLNSDEILPPIGGGRSYGDANFLGTRIGEVSRDKSISLDEATGYCKVTANLTVYEVIKYLSNFKVTLPVIPGTMMATIGGCIASDVHAKNSHIAGSFGQNIISFQLEIGDEIREIRDPSSDFWKCTIGGQGLSGKILQAELKTMKMKSSKLESQIVSTTSYEDFFSKMADISEENEFAVGWIDGQTPFFKERGYIEYCNEVEAEDIFDIPRKTGIWKSWFPRVLLVNNLTIISFNILNHVKIKLHKNKSRIINRWDYMFPMAIFGNWNYFFGSNGFHELQFSCDVVNLDKAIELIREITANHKIFLIGIKLMKSQQTGVLSFPGQDWSIAVNFPANKSTPAVVQRYHEKVRKFEGRVNLTKDWCLTSEMFREMYPKYNQIVELRKKLPTKVASNFSRRVNI
jgi:decaprenylphospho-beta-D-ribofuranose 2-oxidase